MTITRRNHLVCMKYVWKPLTLAVLLADGLSVIEGQSRSNLIFVVLLHTTTIAYDQGLVMHVKRVWLYFIVFLKFHSTKSYLMLPWWRSCLGRSVQKERDLHSGNVAATSDSGGNDGDIHVERKRKAQQSLDQDATPDQECSCCRSVSNSNIISDVQTPAKRFCSQSTLDSEFTTNPNAVTPQLQATEASQQKHQDSLSDAEIQELLWKEANYDSFGLDVTLKRSDYIVWDDFFMGMAKLSAMRSKDPQAPSTGGACIVDEENRVVGIGYNGFPRDCSDDVLPWWSNNDNTQATRPWLYTQSPFVCHAEVNAILNKCSPNVEGARLYVAHFPCKCQSHVSACCWHWVGWTTRLTPCIFFVTAHPLQRYPGSGHDCAKVIIQSRIKEVVYMDDTDHDSDSCRASRIMFTMAGVTMRQYQPRQTSILLDFASVIPPGNHHTSNSNIKEETLARPQQADGVIQYRDLIRIEAGYDPAITSTGKRMTGVLSWDDWFMAVAFLTAKRSKDPNTQVRTHSRGPAMPLDPRLTLFCLLQRLALALSTETSVLSAWGTTDFHVDVRMIIYPGLEAHRPILHCTPNIFTCAMLR